MAATAAKRMVHRPVGLSLLAVLLALAPAADATPPDQTWIAGLYDDGDFDDVILFIMSGLGAVPRSMVRALRPTVHVVGLVTTRGNEAWPLLSLSSGFSRAPPAAGALSAIAKSVRAIENLASIVDLIERVYTHTAREHANRLYTWRR